MQAENYVLDRMLYYFSELKGVKMPDLASLNIGKKELVQYIFLIDNLPKHFVYACDFVLAVVT